jgi:hypothetical protein
MSMVFIAIGGISLGGICYRFAARMNARQMARYSLEKKGNS